MITSSPGAAIQVPVPKLENALRLPALSTEATPITFCNAAGKFTVPRPVLPVEATAITFLFCAKPIALTNSSDEESRLKLMLMTLAPLSMAK